MAELKPFEVIMRIVPIAGQNGKGELVFQVTKQTELVRCKDCAYNSGCLSEKHNDIYCANTDGWWKPDDFCSRGERKVDE